MNDFQPNEGFQNVPSLEEEEIIFFSSRMYFSMLDVYCLNYEYNYRIILSC